MDLARIQRDAYPITLAEWNQILEADSSLEQVPDRTAVNPFTNEVLLVSGIGKAYFIVDQKRVGNACLEDGAILTTGISRDSCEQIAQRLNASVIVEDRS